MLQENLQQWLTDEKARDQFVSRAGTFTEVFWNDPRQLMPDLVYRRQVSICYTPKFSVLYNALLTTRYSFYKSQ